MQSNTEIKDSVQLSASKHIQYIDYMYMQVGIYNRTATSYYLQEAYLKPVSHSLQLSLCMSHQLSLTDRPYFAAPLHSLQCPPQFPALPSHFNLKTGSTALELAKLKHFLCKEFFKILKGI